MVGFVALLKSPIVSYWLARSYWLDRISGKCWIWIRSAGLDYNGWMRTHSWCKDGTDVTDGIDGLDGALVGRGWYGQTLAPSGTGART